MATICRTRCDVQARQTNADCTRVRSPSASRRVGLVACTAFALAVLALGVAALLMRGDHREIVCQALHQGCGRVHASYGVAVIGWVALLVSLIASVIAGLRLVRQYQIASTD